MGWEKIVISSEHLLISYPRSGSNYFQLAWREKTKQNLDCLRSLKMVYEIPKDNTKKIIGLIRSPIEAITSRVLIFKTYENLFDTEEHVYDFSISEYIKFYHYIIKNSDFIVDNSDLKNIDKLVDTISGLSTDPLDNYIVKNKLRKIPYYSTTFVAHRDYESTYNTISSMDIELCQALYEIAYSKRLMV